MAKEGTKRALLITAVLLPLLVGVAVEVFTSTEVLKATLKGLTAMWGFFAKPVALPLGAVLLLPIVAVAATVALIVFLQHRSSAPYTSYTSDLVFGLVWHWDWSGDKMTNMRIFCPSCSYRLIFEEKDPLPYPYTPDTKVECHHCGYEQHWNEPRAKLLDKAVREIERRIRTGEYKKQENAA